MVSGQAIAALDRSIDRLQTARNGSQPRDEPYYTRPRLLQNAHSLPGPTAVGAETSRMSDSYPGSLIGVVAQLSVSSRFSGWVPYQVPMLVLGDAHANTLDRRQALERVYEAVDPDVVLQLGDLFFYDLPVETYFIAGNNEDFDVIDALRHGRVRSRHVKKARLLDSRAVELDGLTIAGLSGNFAPTQYDKPRSALSGDRRRHFVRADVQRLKRVGDVDVLLTHEAPHGTTVREEYSVGCGPIDELLDALDPDLCLVGHHHQYTANQIGDTRVVTLAPAWDEYYELDPDTLALARHDSPVDIDPRRG